jgi:hypothetical protein
MEENKETKQEVLELRKEVAELKKILLDIQATLKTNLIHTQGLYGTITDSFKKR